MVEYQSLDVLMNAKFMITCGTISRLARTVDRYLDISFFAASRSLLIHCGESVLYLFVGVNVISAAAIYGCRSTSSEPQSPLFLPPSVPPRGIQYSDLGDYQFI